MDTLLDRFLLLIFCFILMIFQLGTTSVVVALLCAVAVSSFCMYFERPGICSVLCLVYFITSCFYLPLAMLIPLVCYDAVHSRKWYTLTAMAAALILGLQKMEFYTAILIFLFCILSYVMMKRTKNIIVYKGELLQLKDNSRELNMLLEERQRDYMQKQDYEIHVATLRERNRIAREIHDNVGHLLSRSILMVGALSAVNREPMINEHLGDLKSTLSGAMDSIRNSVHDLHDESIDLKESCQKIIGEFSFCAITLDYDMSNQVNRTIKYCFLAIIKEALSNVIKHSNATLVTIHLWEHPGLYQLLIEDNGTNTRTVNPEVLSDSGIGLENMKERVLAVNGTINFTTKDGFKIFISIKKTPENPELEEG